MELENDTVVSREHSVISQVEKFEKIKILHPKMNEVIEQAIKFIVKSCGSGIFMILGPSGVGKTTLISEVRKRIIDSCLDELERDKSILPLVVVEVSATDSGAFDWKDFWWRCLSAVNEPLIHKKVAYVEQKKENEGNLVSKVRDSGRNLRRAFESALIYRKPKVLIIDEAQHFGKVSSGRSYLNQLDTLKSIYNQTKVPIILVGTYELEPFMNLNGQLGRRTKDQSFSRYDFSIEKDYMNFYGVVNGLVEYLPISLEFNLMDSYEYIYERSIGCVGILKDWLTKALYLALDEGSKSLKMKHLEKTALSSKKILKLVNEILNGEALFAEDKETLDQIHNKLGLTKKNNKKTRGIKNPGTRSPQRDLIGLADNFKEDKLK